MVHPNYCPYCSRPLDSRQIEDRSRCYCPNCDQIIYQNPKPCAGIIVVDDTEVLLIKRSEPPYRGYWSLPAGYLESDEPPEKAATRELQEETSLKIETRSLNLVDTVFVDHSTENNVLVVVYAAARKSTTGIPQAGSDAADVRFWDLDELEDHKTENIEPGYRKTFSLAQQLISDC